MNPFHQDFSRFRLESVQGFQISESQQVSISMRSKILTVVNDSLLEIFSYSLSDLERTRFLS
jgi:hypothetical protein